MEELDGAVCETFRWCGIRGGRPRPLASDRDLGRRAKLGPPSTRKLLFRKHHFPLVFFFFRHGSENKPCMRGCPVQTLNLAGAGRLSVTCPIVTIDGETAREFLTNAVYGRAGALDAGCKFCRCTLGTWPHYVRTPDRLDAEASAAWYVPRLISRIARWPIGWPGRFSRWQCASLKPAERLVNERADEF